MTNECFKVRDHHGWFTYYYATRWWVNFEPQTNTSGGKLSEPITSRTTRSTARKMPPKQASRAGRTVPKASKNARPAAASNDSSDPFESADEVEAQQAPAKERRAEESSEAEKSIPTDLLTRVLHEFFLKDSTRISRDANAAVGKYMDVFVREAIARAAVEKKGGFLEVEDLEKISPQLLLDL
ncbi:CENP-S associating centromere protein X-domain-containing protein [Stachybotrys elegans]|uniref:CENP-S associating centromere protein X-domain-containing protein n=1 Tax=Stachybotrys elegans TaxID=80388 RepID=A0A8K0SNX6_9HYPO|nr:CENP-S associating centromere protein X-domain-containing protein [Stachybotrys elegans]